MSSYSHPSQRWGREGKEKNEEEISMRLEVWFCVFVADSQNLTCLAKGGVE